MPHRKHKNVGVIGLGIIGRGVTANLRRKGFSVFVWNRTPRPVPNFVGSPAELVPLCNYIQIFVSDDKALLEARPILKASSKEIIEIGKIGQATAIKIATNMVTAASVQATAEALALVHAQNVPLAKFVKAMQANASHSTTLAMKMPKMIKRDFEPHFSVKHMLKDMQIANQVGLSLHLDLGVTAAARDRLLEQLQLGRGDDDFSAVARKYLPETGSTGYEEPQMGEQDEQA